jgi:hypothetical protein
MRLFKGSKIPIVVFSFLNITNTKINFYQVSHIPLPIPRPTNAAWGCAEGECVCGNAITILVATLQMRLEGLFSPKKTT